MSAAIAEIRAATAADIPALLPLVEALFALEPDFRFDAAKACAGLLALLGSPRGLVLVAVEGERVVGMGTLQEPVSTAEGGPVGVIEDIVVAEAARGRGFGKRLVEALTDAARARGYARVQLLADKDNRAALAFYRHLGWDETNLVCLKRVL